MLEGDDTRFSLTQPNSLFPASLPHIFVLQNLNSEILLDLAGHVRWTSCLISDQGSSRFSAGLRLRRFWREDFFSAFDSFLCFDYGGGERNPSA